MKLGEKFTSIIEKLNDGLIGKERILIESLALILCGENIILIGPPGTAKSEIARRLTSIIKDGTCFEYLMTKFTTPEEIFGPLSLKKLKEDKFERNVEGYLPDASIAFLDEIFKSNSSILNALLTIINEKTYINGNNKIHTNIISIIGASNELPTNESELNALYDRFVLRKVVSSVANEKFRELVSYKSKPFVIKEEEKITKEDLEEIKREINEIIIPDGIIIFLNNLYNKLNSIYYSDPVETISDRKLIKLVKILKVMAIINNRKEVVLKDTLILRDCIWSKMENMNKIHKIFDDFYIESSRI